jgi:predicted nucleic acid-binding protein
LLAAFQVMPVEWMQAADYEDQRAEADRRVAARDPDDWPTLALALKLAVPIWSQDKDFTDTGVEVVTTGVLLDAMRAAGHPEP